jgi:hypothetical protein
MDTGRRRTNKHKEQVSGPLRRDEPPARGEGGERERSKLEHALASSSPLPLLASAVACALPSCANPAATLATATPAAGPRGRVPAVRFVQSTARARTAMLHLSRHCILPGSADAGPGTGTQQSRRLRQSKGRAYVATGGHRVGTGFVAHCIACPCHSLCSVGSLLAARAERAAQRNKAPCIARQEGRSERRSDGRASGPQANGAPDSPDNGHWATRRHRDTDPAACG